MAKGANNTPTTRKTKANNNRQNKPLVALNDKQQEYINSIIEYPVVICTGVLGSSKTYIPSVLAADWLMQKKIDKIIVARPAEGAGKSVGFFKGSLNEKLSVWCAPILDTLKQRIGQGHYEEYLEHGKIELLPLEAVKGRSWDNCVILVDECEDIDPVVAKSLVTRHGTNTKTIISGDIAQKDIKKESGLELLLYLAKKYELPVKHVDFSDWKYCVRSEEAKQWGMAFEQHERLAKA